MRFFILALGLTMAFALAKPMESIERYNIILVHGAADSLSGMDCSAADLKDAYSYWDNTADTLKKIEGYLKISWAPKLKDLDHKDTSRSTAVGIIKTLPGWMAENIFDGDPRSIYLNRSFKNPANTPFVNSQEIGSRTWKGTNKCSVRRSLVEEAEEVRNSGEKALISNRQSPSVYKDHFNNGYSTHRNIIISHSMGGVASREYVQGDYYNSDVDKVILLDSPNEGTHSLEGLLDLKDWESNFLMETSAQTFATSLAFGLAGTFLNGGPIVDNLSVKSIAIGLASANVTNAVVDLAVDLNLGYGYKDSDPLVDYIVPGSDALTTLNTKPYNSNLPMIRLLYSSGGLTFGSNKEYGQEIVSLFVPDAIYVPIKNVVAQTSHTEIDNPAYINNIFASGTLGAIAGLSLTDHGSILIPHWSGSAEDVAALNDNRVDVVKKKFNANENTAEQGLEPLYIVTGAVVALAAASVVEAIYPPIGKAARLALSMTAGAVLSYYVVVSGMAAIEDMQEGHKNPSTSEWQKKQYSSPNAYSLVTGGSETVTPLLMEDFLYEKPFVNLAVHSANDWLEVADSTNLDSLGLYGGDSALSVMDMKKTRETPLSFSSGTAWGKMGVKVDRWTRVDGLDANGNLDSGAVPIRHVERYEVPSIAVKDYIRKYSFVVDDLMPNRLRQIRMNFNYNEDIAWECDVTADTASNSACVVYKRSSDGTGWHVDSLVGNNGFVHHPVNKDGTFNFVPEDYDYPNLLVIQKDNQNTVTISTVNKIGLSNSQRFYYLFKATADFIQPVWPLSGVAVTRAQNFSVFASSLAYQGFSFDAASDTLFADSAFNKSSADTVPHILRQSMDFVTDTGNGTHFSSRIAPELPEGVYVWQVRFTEMGNGSKDSSITNEVSFVVDHTPPSISLYTDASLANPDSSAFLARFVNLDSADIRALRFTLEHWGSGKFIKVAELPALHDVMSPEFAITWDGAGKDTLADGLYRVKAFAIDRAVSSREAYDSVNTLVSKIVAGTVQPTDWDIADKFSLNRGEATAEFRVDRTAPGLRITSLSTVPLSDTGTVPQLFAGPSRRTDLAYLGGDSLLSVNYSLEEPLAGRDSAVAKIEWRYVHVPDTDAVDRAGDSVIVRAEGALDSSWRELSGMKLSDGDYFVRGVARDEAGNARTVVAGKKLRVDRTAPQIVSLVSTKLTYLESKNFSATFKVSQAADVDSNRTGYTCDYRVTGPSGQSAWYGISMGGKDSVFFSIDSAAVGTANGKRYLEVACVDAAGNVGYRTDLFHVGDRYPVITSPDSTTFGLSGPVVTIWGEAPASERITSDTVTYRLRYRAVDATGWDTLGIDVGAGKRKSDAEPWFSNGAQPTEGVLGFWNRPSFGGTYWIELGVRSCGACAWVTDSVQVYLEAVFQDSVAPMLVLTAPKRMTAGEDTALVSARVSSNDISYSMRIFARDAAGNALFEASSDNVRNSPYRGVPADTTHSKGIWFYGTDSLWSLVWKGLDAKDTIHVYYLQSGFGEECLGTNGTIGNCHVGVSSLNGMEQISSVASVFANFPEYGIPEKLDRVMALYGTSGHLVLRASSPFYVVPPIGDSLVYFGNSAAAGLYGTSGVSVPGFSVDESRYSLSRKWSGLSDAGTYPSGGTATLYAEAVENTIENPRVLRDSVQISLTLPALKVIVTKKSLPDFTVIQQSQDGTFILGKMHAAYGISGRDALVSAFVLSPAGDTLKILFSSEYRRSGISDFAYSLTWDGTDMDGHPVSAAGAYTLIIAATEAYPGDVANPQKASLPLAFKLSVSPGMTELPLVAGSDSAGPMLSVSEAVDDEYHAGQKRYAPVADYLVHAELYGKYLPKILRDSLRAEYSVSGTQQALGYAPHRFSLGIKRQRDSLDLIYVAKITRYMEENSYFNPVGLDDLNYIPCHLVNQKHDQVIRMGILTFTELNHSTTALISVGARKDNAYDDDKIQYDRIDIIVLMLKDWNAYLNEKRITDTTFSASDFDNLKVLPYTLWKLDDISGDTNGVHIPVPSSGESAFSKEAKASLGCVAENGPSADSSVACVYGSDTAKNTGNYNPNLNLFDLHFYGQDDSATFYHDYSQLDSRCGDLRWKEILFNVTFSIPDSYWNAPFGYDNLVNRTIRFDHTNKTIFGATDGYLKALWDSVQTGTVDSAQAENFFDGTRWQAGHEYGMLTPFEMQHLKFLPAAKFPGSLNTFLFADETPSYQYPSYFTLKFFGSKEGDSHFEAKVLGATIGEGACDATSMDALAGLADPRCQNTVMSNGDSVKTPLFAHGYVDFFVGFNQKPEENVDSVKIPYPASGSWKTASVLDTCGVDYTASGETSAIAGCKKYYRAGSRVHYYPGDYSDTLWSRLFTTTQEGYVRNPVNSPTTYTSPENLAALSIDTVRFGDSSAYAVTLSLDPNLYRKDSSEFYLPAARLNLPFDKLSGMSAETSLRLDSLGSLDKWSPMDASRYRFSDDTLYVKASSWVDSALYRRTVQSPSLALPTPTNSIALTLHDLFRYRSGSYADTLGAELYSGDSSQKNWTRNPWVKGLSLASAELFQLDSAEHSHFYVSSFDTNKVNVSYRTKPLSVRPAEFVELRGRSGLTGKFTLAYLKDSVFYPIADGTFSGTEPRRLSWFDVNRLQGNTTLLLEWGGADGSMLNYAKLDLNIGSLVRNDTSATVKSLFGEVSVTFPAGAVTDPLDVTVRTANASDYNFSVFNGAALTGPVIEVLPSMLFPDSVKPRVQMKISRTELEENGLTPARVRLYKIDFANSRFVPLEHSLYGYLRADGSAAVNGASNSNAMCSPWNNPACFDANWKYLLISAETSTFSVFAALDSVMASLPSLGIKVLPEVGIGLERSVQVTGYDKFNLYVDDDSLWNDTGDKTPPASLAYTKDSLGGTKITLPARDSSWIFAIAKNDSGESVSAPTRSLVMVVPAELVCSVPQDSLWLGLDNGYLAFAQNCNQPALGVLSVWKGTSTMAEVRRQLPDSIFFDGSVNASKIGNGVYASRYLAVSLLGDETQLAGPAIYTDSARPRIPSFEVSESSDLLDRIFDVSAVVSDSESGLASVRLVWTFGMDTLGTAALNADSSGLVQERIRVSRSTLSKCLGCAISISFRAEDFGHNHSDTLWTSESLWPYPAGLALWYPAMEGSGNTAYEMLGTGHNLALSMKSPWLSASGLYFYTYNDRAVGAGAVDLGTSSAWTLEAWVRPGYVTGNAWKRLMGFRGTTGTSFELDVKGKDLRLVEGSDSWTVAEALSQAKVWSHVAVTVDSSEIRFYVDGNLLSAIPATAKDRELYGTFSLGSLSTGAFTGHVHDARLYRRALSASEIQALFLNAGSDEDSLHTTVALASNIVADEGASYEFSCAVPGSNYWVVVADSSVMTATVFVEKSATYKVVAYVRAASAMTVTVKAGVSGQSLLSGTLDIETVWRPVVIEGVSLNMASGYSQLSLVLPQGVQIAGVALTDDPSAVASRISWKTSSSGSVASMLSASVKFEGYPDVSMLRPRVHLTNNSNSTVNGFSVRYYFRGEDPSQVKTSAFYPSDNSSGLAVHAESGETGYVEWKFPDVSVAPGASPFYGQGPHFGIYNAGYEPWLATDDPSFVEGADTGFVNALGIVVLDNDNRALAGSCAEMEDSTSSIVKVHVLAKDSRNGDASASQIYITLQNTGTAALKNYEVRYSFYVEEGLAPIFDVYDIQGLSAEMTSLGSGRWQVSIQGAKSIGPGNSWQNPAQFALHLSGWEQAWNAADDPSHAGLTTNFVEATGIEVFDSLGNRIYGEAPVWPEAVVTESDTTSSGGYSSGTPIPVRLTEDGLVLTLTAYSSISLDLVNAIGIPVKSIYSGTLASGDQFIAVDWSGISMNTTYLMIRLNGQIVSTQKLSSIGE